MTNNGWKLIKDVDIEKDIIMSLNPETKQIEMVKAIDFISSPVDGELYHFHNQSMDFCVTGNHKMYSYYKTSNKGNQPMPLINAEDVKKTHLLPISGFKWDEGKNEEYFYLPATTQLEQYSRKKIVVPEKKILMKDWLEFFGFWLADGCYRDHINVYGKRDYTISIKQNEKNEAYVLNLFEKIGFEKKFVNHNNKTGNHNYNIYSKQLWSYLEQFGRSTEKYIPREFLELDKSLLKCLLKGYLKGDGSKCADGHYHISSVSKQLIDNIQELILKVYGLNTQIRMAKRKHSYDDNYGICYSNVYCLTLEKNHIMLVRHNGIIGWCGNCFREYTHQLMEYDKKFLIIGNKNAITYKEFFPLLKDDKVWLGYTSPKEFLQPDGSIKKFGNIGWFTNLDIDKRHEELVLWQRYYDDDGNPLPDVEERYPHYDNYPEAINVDKVANIPCDYYGVMGVPITFCDVANDEYQIVGVTNHGPMSGIPYTNNNCFAEINGKRKYVRIFIKRK